MALLRSRELHGRADWVDRELPERIDIAQNAALLQTLGIDVATMPTQTQADVDGASEQLRR